MTNETKKIIRMLAGPTASGKTALALTWANELNGEIVNADSMQIYRELSVLTACPSPEEEAAAPHHLFRTLKGDDPCSADRWRIMALEKIEDIWARGKVPIVVGGTGMYFKTLIDGLAEVPEIDPAIREEIRHLQQIEGATALYEQLSQEDPVMAERLNPSDSQRIARALEVIRSTGRSLADWQAEPLRGGLVERPDVTIEAYALEMDREKLYARCDLRFRQMIEQGEALQEVEELMKLNYDPELPVMKSLGVPQLAAHIAGEMPLEDAISDSQMMTRRYAKRQMTWIRNQCQDWIKIKL